jgi:peptide/nickel transport system substrate-binding protein
LRESVSEAGEGMRPLSEETYECRSPARGSEAWSCPLLTLCLLLLLAVAFGQPARAEEHRQLTIGINQFPGNFNPLNDKMAVKSYILGLADRPLTAYDKDWRLVCMLCTDLPTLANGQAVTETSAEGKPGMAVTYTLQPKASWGDGVPVTTEDIVFTWEVGKHPQSGVSAGELFRRILSIEVKDAKTFTLHLDRRSFDYNDMSDFDVLSAHLERQAFNEPSQYRTHSLFETDTTNPGLYHGPYRITQVARGQYVVLERNPHWWGKAPAFDKIVVKSIEASPALEANLLSGGIDMIAGEAGMTVDAAIAFEAEHHRGDWQVIYKPGLTYDHFSLNFDNPILADKRVRHALLLGLDRETLVRQLFHGKQTVARSLVNSLDWCYDPNVSTDPFDPAAAAQLLDQAGWAMGADGYRHNAKGQRLRVELMTTAGMRVREIIELVAEQDWKRIGVEVHLRNQPARVFFGDSVLKHNFPGLALFAWMSPPENVPLYYLRSDMVPSRDNGFAGQNVGAYRNPAMDRLIDAIEAELDRDKRRQLWSELQALYAEDLPDLPLTYRSDPYILPAWLKGVEPTGHMFATTLWVENWRVE